MLATPQASARAARRRVMTRLLTGAITIYQKTLSVALGPRCRFYPSCSQYAKECLETYPLPSALARISGRLLRCHPFHPGGVDLP
jgi:putative membrane protein insertion efficiency factor